MKHKHFDFVVLGAGISGLSAALEVEKLGRKVLVLDKGESPGGVLQSVEHGRFIWDKAAHTIAVDDEVLSFFQAYGADQLLEEPGGASKVRKIAIGNKIYEVSNHPAKILGSSFLSIGAKLQIIKELFKKPIKNENPTVREFFQYHFGVEITENIISAVFAGIYAGDIEKLEMRSVMEKVYLLEQENGSLIRGLIKDKDSFGSRKICGVKGGMKSLVNHLASQLTSIAYRAKVSRIKPMDQVLELTVDEETITCNQLISTIPSYSLAPIITNEEIGKSLEEIEYEPMVLIHVAYDQIIGQQEQKAFGFLCGQYASPVLKGAIFNSDLFPGRVPDGYQSFTIFMKPVVAWLEDGDVLDAQVKETISHFATLTQIKTEPKVIEKTIWKRAIPQFNVPYQALKRNLLEKCEEIPGFHLSGSFISGVSVSDCINFNIKLARRLCEM